MAPHTPQGWEPEPQKMGNWRAMFEEDRSARRPDPPPVAQDQMPREAPADDEALALDLSVYKPWILQRWRSRPAMMLELRRYEPRSGLWTACAIAYPHLVALDYTGDKMLSLDFGTRQYVLEGTGLDELARHIQQGSAMAIQEHAPTLWPDPPGAAVVTRIRQVGQAGAP